MGMERAGLSSARLHTTGCEQWIAPASDIPDDCSPEVVLPSRPYAEQGLTWLARTIEHEIIPRLMLAHQTGPLNEDFVLEESSLIEPHEVQELSRLVLMQDALVAASYVDAVRVRGVALEAVYAELLAPAARFLGAMWEADRCDFTQVTVGLWRLQQVMYDLSPLFQQHAVSRDPQRKGLLVPVPGSQHTLGVFMVAEYFRKAGWIIEGEPNTTGAELLETVRSEWFDLVGFSLGSEQQIPELTSLITAIKRASRNPSLGIMVGGPLLLVQPELLTSIGADITAVNAAEAVEKAEVFIAAMAARC